MNGRAYDYNLGRFLSVDPFIQEPGNSQSMNPYSYIMNNPLSGTDPTGYVANIYNNGKESNGEEEEEEPPEEPPEGCQTNWCVKITYDDDSVDYVVLGNGSNTSNSSSSNNDSLAPISKGNNNSSGGISLDNPETNDVKKNAILSDGEKNKLWESVSYKFRFGVGPGVGESDVKTQLGYLVNILSTKAGRKMLWSIEGRININIISDSYTPNSTGEGFVQMNIGLEQRYAQAFGENNYVKLGGMRSLAHELAHRYYHHSGGSKAMKAFEEKSAMRKANLIMKEFYGDKAGERSHYQGLDRRELGDDPNILR